MVLEKGSGRFSSLGMSVSNCTKYLTSCFPTIIIAEWICSAILAGLFGTNPVKKPTDCRDYAVYLAVHGHLKLFLTDLVFKIIKLIISVLHVITADIEQSTSCLKQAVIFNLPEQSTVNYLRLTFAKKFFGHPQSPVSLFWLDFVFHI